MSTKTKVELFALRPFNDQYQEAAWWVHLDDGSGEPLRGERKPGRSLLPELITADNPHVCEPCRLIAEAARHDPEEDKAAHAEMVLSGL